MKKTIPILMETTTSSSKKRASLPHWAKRPKATTSATNRTRIPMKAAKVAPKCVAQVDTHRELLLTAHVAAVEMTIAAEAVAAFKKADLAAAAENEPSACHFRRSAIC